MAHLPRVRGFARVSSVVALAATVGALAGSAFGCAGAPEDETTGQTIEPLTAYCQAQVKGVGNLDVETDYLPNVVHCENGGAPFEALKAQAVAARSYLYYKLETSGSVSDGQGDQVYSCGSAPTNEQMRAVKETEGLVLRYKNTTVCSFFVAGGAANPPACKGASGGTESYVTYNDGLSGANVHQTSLGSQDPSNYRNRGCLSQLGSRCLADEGKTFDQILHFYYGADIGIEQASGPCVTPLGDAGVGDGGAGGGGGGNGGTVRDAGAGAADANYSDDELPGNAGQGSCSCTTGVGAGSPRSAGVWGALGLALVLVGRRRRARRDGDLTA